MKVRSTVGIPVLAIIFSIPVVAIAQMKGGMESQKMMQMMMPKSGDPASTKDLKQTQMDMMENMNTTFTGKPDADFV